MMMEQIAKGDSLLFDHLCAPLSSLDMEMIRSIPPGGNWQDIPLHTVEKSARLMQIRNSGGRTTYYGRLREDFPSYTINTYFNRPGNGTFVHPSQDRLISLREAARLQSFPDKYRFRGSISSRFKQIGNAVPPLVGKAFGSRIRRGRIVDLFAGAGGLSEGLKLAGHQVVVSSDINPNMCETLTHNHPESVIIRSDVSQKDLFHNLIDSIENELKGKTLRMLTGGPPCQGFSTAGKWDSSDSRNSLILSMLKAVEELQPEYVLIENVLGLRWMKSGTILQNLLEKLEFLEYKTSWRIIRAEEFGVPQRRRRIFILGKNNGEHPDFPESDFSFIKRGRTRDKSEIANTGLPNPIPVRDAISDLPPIPSGGGSELINYDDEWIDSSYQELMRNQIEYEQFLRQSSLLS